jgi:hypothetical protein
LAGSVQPTVPAAHSRDRKISYQPVSKSNGLGTPARALSEKLDSYPLLFLTNLLEIPDFYL